MVCLGTAGSEPRWEVLEFEAGEEGGVEMTGKT